MDLIGVTAVVGAALLFAALLFAVISNRRRSRGERRRTQAATKDLYRKIDD
jgi:Flp pilus assembly protein TadB